MNGFASTAACVAFLVSACTSTKAPEAMPSTATEYRGWYLEHAGNSQWQACGDSRRQSFADPGGLPARAKTFGLGDDTPVYVRFTATLQGEALRVESVEQFGSPAPVRDCAMDGVVTPQQ